MRNNYIKVKISTALPDFPLIRQTPGNNGIWGNCKFFINQDIKECDWWIIYDGLYKKESAYCPAENTLLITGEPPNVKKYDEKFIKQFHQVLTCHEQMKHPNKIISQQSLGWLIGINIDRINKKIDLNNIKDYDFFSNLNNIEKSKTISVITSNKKTSKEHVKRIDFVEKLKNHFKEKLDVYGGGINDFLDKWDVIAPYKYHIVLENSSYDHYWTEKLADCFLAGSYPVYYGCPNIYDYFPKNSITKIDINDINNSIEIFEKTIYSDNFERYQKELFEAKKLVLGKYNLFAMINELVNQKVPNNKKSENITIYPENYFKTCFIKKVVKKILRYGR